MAPRPPQVLVILDGWGHSTERVHNAIAQANTPFYDQLLATRPLSLLDASGASVGLPQGQMGNSEVGHLTLGAGRVVLQTLPRIHEAVRGHGLRETPALAQLVRDCAAEGRRLHLWGLVSPGGVHSHEDHFVALVRLAKEAGVADLRLHAVLDGRDTPPRSAAPSLQKVEAALAEAGYAPVASVCGRYWAMDRDKRWDRLERAWKLYRSGLGGRADTAAEALQAAYDAGQGDEFVEPARTGGFAPWEDGDALAMVNFRPDRARQLAGVLGEGDFDGFARGGAPQLRVVTMTSYGEELSFPVAFPMASVDDGLGAQVSAAGLRQLRVAETEKYAHVTYFFNGGREEPLPGEERVLIPSPKVATYDLCPQMSAEGITAALEEAILGRSADLIVCNYANGDMVGHTGKMPAAVAAVQVLDGCLARLAAAIEQTGGDMLVTADHGNCECMAEGEGEHTAHTVNPVPLLHLGRAGVELEPTGTLGDVAPTLMALLGLEQPASMTGRSLLKARQAAEA